MVDKPKLIDCVGSIDEYVSSETKELRQINQTLTLLLLQITGLKALLTPLPNQLQPLQNFIDNFPLYNKEEL